MYDIIVTGKLIILAKLLEKHSWQSIQYNFKNFHRRHSEIKRGEKTTNQSNARPLAFKPVLHRNQTWLHSLLKAQPLISIFRSKSSLATSNRLLELIEKSIKLHTAFTTLHQKKKANPNLRRHYVACREHATSEIKIYPPPTVLVVFAESKN